MANNDERRWMQRFENLERANLQLTRACDLEELSELELTGLIKSFEITFELAWKTLKDLLYYEGFEVGSPRAAIRKAFEAGILADSRLWLEALESRNLMSHTYDAAKAKEAERLIKDVYAPMLDGLVNVLHERKGQSRNGD